MLMKLFELLRNRKMWSWLLGVGVGIFFIISLTLWIISTSGDHTTPILPPLPIVEKSLPPFSASPGNHVLSARHVVTNKGERAPGVRVGEWSHATRSVRTPSGSGITNTTDLIYVHGYETSVSDAVEQGNQLLSKIKAQLLLMKPTLPISDLVFHTFLWRGNLGAVHFGSAESAAINSGPSLAEFILHIKSSASRKPDHHRVVVLSHSLGAGVILEALKSASGSEQEQLIDGLLLFQPAVSWSEIAKGNYRLTEKWPGEPNGGFYYTNTSERFEGRYFDCLRVANEVVITQSHGDQVLKTIRRLRKNFDPSAMRNPDIFRALGLPTYYGEARFGHERLRFLDLSPGSGKPIKLHEHSQLFSDAQLFRYLWEEFLQTFFVNSS